MPPRPPRHRWLPRLCCAGFAERLSFVFAIPVIVEPDDDGFHAYAPGLKGLHTDGRTEEEAIANAIEAIKAYLESLVQHGDPLPIGPDCELSRVQPEPYRVPVGAFMRHVTLQWPSLHTSGPR